MVNASLYLTNVRVEFGLAVVGGAIAASRSNLTLNQTFFVSNQARGMGGALYVMDESIVSFDGEMTFFAKNVADSSGGAIYVAGGSVVSWKGRNTFFIDNIAYIHGGAIAISVESVASWSGLEWCHFLIISVEGTGAPYTHWIIPTTWLGMGRHISSTTLLAILAAASLVSTALTFHGVQR